MKAGSWWRFRGDCWRNIAIALKPLNEGNGLVSATEREADSKVPFCHPILTAKLLVVS